MIDWNRVAELRDEVGEEDFQEIVDFFLEEMAETIDPLRDGARPDNWPALLHFLKGAALNLGFRHLGIACQKAEADGGLADGTALANLFDQSKACLIAGP